MQSDGATSYVKIHPGADVAALHANGVALWNASRDGRLGFAVARPDRFDLDTHALWQHAIDGRPLLDRLLDDGEGVALGERLGRALATLTGSGLRPAAAPPRSSPLERGRSAGRDLARRVPALEPTVTAVLARIETLHDAAGERAARPIHGAPHPSQWLQTGDGLALVDFDGFALGDPELDIAVLQAEIEDERAPAGVSEAVVTGYEALAGPLDPRVLTAYRAIGRLSTARRRARAVRADGRSAPSARWSGPSPCSTPPAPERAGASAPERVLGGGHELPRAGRPVLLQPAERALGAVQEHRRQVPAQRLRPRAVALDERVEDGRRLDVLP